MSKYVEQLKLKLTDTETVIATKPDYQVWWHAVASWLMQAIFRTIFAVTLGKVNRDFNDYWTTFGEVIYAPEGTQPRLEELRTYSIVCHELAHRYDDRAHGMRYRLTYLVSWSDRASWEVRGYGMQLVALYRRTGVIQQRHISKFAEAITGPTYLWAGDREKVEAQLTQLADALRSGRLNAAVFDPNSVDVFPEP